MADQVVHEPKVSVHGIPQSQYEANAGASSGGGAPSGGGGFIANFKQHWQLYSILIGAGVVGLILIVYYMNNQSASAGVGAGDTTGTGTSGTPASDQSWGAQLDSDYQQMQYNQNTEIGLLQQLINQGAAPVPTQPPTTPTFHAQSLFPDAKHTAGESDNFWVYTTKVGDTIDSINQMANWGPNSNGKANALTYRNNASILSQIGYTSTTPSEVLPTGTKLSV